MPPKRNAKTTREEQPQDLMEAIRNGDVPVAAKMCGDAGSAQSPAQLFDAMECVLTCDFGRIKRKPVLAKLGEMARILIKAGCPLNDDPATSADDGRSLSPNFDCPDIVAALLDAGRVFDIADKDETEAHRQSMWDYVGNIKVHLTHPKSSLRVDTCGDTGRTVLHRAAFMGSPKTVAMLLELGAAPVGIETKDHQTPLLACLSFPKAETKAKYQEVAKMLAGPTREAGLLDVKDRFGKTAADYCKSDAELKALVRP